ncbi:MAG TPA: PLP-dependent aminotransferase family protein [Solirubrobacteraceae bacterium]|jgi:GntR family transcriptional regulator/MocR family aminotransferase
MTNSALNSQTNRGEGRRAEAPGPGFAPDLLIGIDRTRRDLRAQLERGLRDAIQDGRLPVGTVLPPSRTLARELALARSVVVEAYSQLAAEGYLHSRQGSATRVLARSDPPHHQDSPGPPADSVSAIFQARLPDQASFDTHAQRHPDSGIRLTSGGLPDPASFPRQTWIRHYRAVVGGQPDASFRYPQPQGTPELRQALASHLSRVRAVRTTPDRLMICSGFAQGLSLVCGVLRSRGVTAVAVEDPCFSYHRRLIRAAGLQPVHVPVDEEGLDVTQLGDRAVGAVLLSPAHSYPTGAVLSADRRAHLLDWARDSDALIIEDDYDAEFRYDRTPVGTLQGLAPDHVIYGASTSKILTPALRLGWLAAPEHLLGDLLVAKALHDLGTETFGQLTLARFIDSGDLGRHLRRMRPVYHARRDALVHAFATHLPDATPTGVAAGLHLFIHLPDDCDEDALVEAAERHGLHLEGAARHWANPRAAPPALVIGYGALHETSAARAVSTLAAAYADVR